MLEWMKECSQGPQMRLVALLMLMAFVGCGESRQKEIDGLPGVHVGDTIHVRKDYTILEAKDSMVHVEWSGTKKISGDGTQPEHWAKYKDSKWMEKEVLRKWTYKVKTCPHKD